MKFTLIKLKYISSDILEKYKKEFILPLNTEVNYAIYIRPTAEDIDEQIYDMTKLIGMTKIALVIINVDNLFIKDL